MSEVSPITAIPTLRQLAMPKDTNALGTIFGGVILSQIDTAAAIEAHKHHRGSVVTVAMDAQTHKLGRTSVTIDIDVFAQRQFAEEGDFIEVTSARAVMVAVDENNKPIALNK
jgi:acyl-CoA thioesterase YciA